MIPVLLAVLGSSSAAAGDAPDDAIRHDGTSYAFVAAPGIDAAGAREACATSGGTLARLPSPAALEALSAAKRENPAWASLWVWIDGKSCTTAPPDWAFCWSDGSPVSLPQDAWARDGRPAPQAAPVFLRADGSLAANPAFRGVPAKAGYLCAWDDAPDEPPTGDDG